MTYNIIHKIVGPYPPTPPGTLPRARPATPCRGAGRVPVSSKKQFFRSSESVQFFLEQIALCVLRYPPLYLSVNFLRFAKLSTFFLLGLRYVVVAYPHLNPTVHFLRFKKWTLRNSEVSTFLTPPWKEKSGQLEFRECPLF